MEINDILADKQVKPAQKTEILSKLLLSGEIGLDQLITFAGTAKDPAKASCVEAIEYATKSNPAIATPECFEFVTDCLASKAPRLKWESARVIGNVCHLFPEGLETAIKHLLENSEHAGTVVRWSAAFALGQILKLNTGINRELRPAVQTILEREEKNSIRKIYSEALKKSK